MAGGEVGARAIAFIATAYLTRRLGPSAFGLVGFATAFTGYFSLFVGGGIARVGARAVARDPASAPALVSALLVVRSTIALACYAVLYFVIPHVGLAPDEQSLVRLSGLILFSVALDVTWAYKGLERGTEVAVATMVGQGVMLAMVLLLVRGSADVNFAPIAQVLGEMVAVSILAVPLLLRARSFARAAAVSVLRAAAVPGVTRILRALIFTFDVLLLGFLGRRAELGLYTAAYRVCLLVLAVQVALHSSYWAAGARAKSPAEVGAVITRAIALAAAVGLPMVIGGALLATPLMALLFGKAYAGGGPMLVWLLVSIGCTLGHGAYTAALVVVGASRRELAIMSAAALVNVIGNLIVVPTHGALGAAIVTAGSEGVALTLCVLAGIRAGWAVTFRPLRPTLAAVGVMALVLLAVPDALPVVVSVLLGGVVYVAALLRFGVPDDAQPMLTSVRSRLGIGRRID